MEMDEGGFRYSDHKYFDPFTSDEEDSEDELYEGRFGEGKNVADHVEEETLKSRIEPESTELPNPPATADDENVDGIPVGETEEEGDKQLPLFNGKDYGLLTIDDMKDVHFPTVDEAEQFYAFHSKVVGFSIRKDRQEKESNGLVIRRQWVCSKHGKAVNQGQKKKGVCGNKSAKEHSVAPPKKHKRNIVPRGKRFTRVGCQALFSIRYSFERQSYYVSRFMHEHNHDLAWSDEVQFLRSHRSVKPHHIAQAEALREVQVHTSKVYEYLVEQAGGHEAIGFTLKDLYNRLAEKRRIAEIEGDAQSALTWMNMRGLESDQFFCRYSQDEEGRLANLFWRDSQSLLDYQVYGDVLIMDSTYKTNMYGKPLVVFVGCNNHRATTVFGFALIADEREDTYSWVFEKFLESMNHKQPNAVLTDQDESIRNVVQRLMPEAKHRLCAWHIGRNIGQNVKDVEAQKSLGSMIYASLTPREWEAVWHSIVSKHGLSDNTWVTQLFYKRERWAEAFFRGVFFGGMCSTQRVECMHSKFKDDIGTFTRICEVMPRMERTIGRIRNRVLYDNFQSKNSAPVYETQMRGIEEEACRLFTHDIFVMIKAQILFEGKFVISHKQSFPLSDSMMFYLTQYERPGRYWSVQFVSDPKYPKWMCSCKLFESDGIPCCHIFSVLKYQMVTVFPKSLVMWRWSKEVGERTVVPKVKRITKMKSAQVARYSALVSEVSKACLNYSYSEEGFTVAMGEFAKLHQASILFRNAIPANTSSVPASANVVKDPKVTRTKGAPSKTAQNSEKGKHTYICKKCFLPGHNRRTCTYVSSEHATPSQPTSSPAHQSPFFNDSQQSTPSGIRHSSFNMNQPHTTEVDMQENLSSDSLPPNTWPQSHIWSGNN